MQSYINVRLDSSYSRGESMRRRVLPGLKIKEEDEPGMKERLKHWLRKFVAFLFSQVGVGALLLVYTIIGASIFINIEATADEGLLQSVDRLRAQVVLQLWNITQNYNVIYLEKWEEEADLVITSFQNDVLASIRRGYNGRTDEKWTFPKALMYSLSVYTTIGYGNLSPRTEWGKVFTCIYAIFGIPLLLLYMTTIGSLLANSFVNFYVSLSRCKERIEEVRTRRRRAGNGEAGVIDHYAGDGALMITSEGNGKRRSNEVTIPITHCLFLFFLYVLLGTFFFSFWEDWDFVQGAYFCFTSLVTIGFGDVVPGHALGQRSKQYVDGQLIMCCVYILFGMGLISTLFHLTQERFFMTARKLGKALHLI